MKKVRHRTAFTIVLVVCFILGMGLLLFRYVTKGSDWAGFSGNRAVYADGTISKGGIYDRNGVLLYDAATNSYNDSKSVRVSTLHAVGDQQGMIATSALQEFSGKLSGFNIITGNNGGGNNLYLTIDSELNKVAYDALGDYKGCVGVYNYKTGEIICMVSTPSYDPENVPDISDDDDRYTGVYLNRFLSATYTPGSTFKIVTLAAAINTVSDLDDESFYCEGSQDIGGSAVNCTGTHGNQDIVEAFANSCNVAFGNLAVEVGAKSLNAYVEKAGLTENHKVDGINTAAGSFTAETSDTNLLAWSGIGQDKDLVNPCAMLRLMGAIANDGVPVEPRLIKTVKSATLGIPTGIYGASKGSRIWSASTCEQITEMMRNNVEVTYGQSRFGDLKVCAKSGTAETNEAKPTSWFVGFIDDDDHPYAFVVVCENAGYGSSVAGTIAGTVLTSIDSDD